MRGNGAIFATCWNDAASDAMWNAMKSMLQARYGIPVALGIVFGLAGWAMAWLMPSLERAVYDWRVTHQLAVAHDARAVLVPVEDRDPLFCGSHRWNRLALARVISSLSQARVAVIAPVASLRDIPSPECGGVMGEARLMEATARAGIVVYPTTVAEPLADAARAIGTMDVEPDDDGIVRRLRPFHDDIPPLGVAIASVMIGRELRSPQGERLIPIVGRPNGERWARLPFAVVWNALERRTFEELAPLVEGKAVILFPSANDGVTVATPVDPRMPLAFVHAAILDAILTDTWLVPVPWSIGLMSAFLLAALGAWLVLRFGGLRGWAGIGAVLVVYLVLAHAAFVFWGLVLPVVAVTMGSIFVGIGTQVWTLVDTHRRVQSRLNRIHMQLARLREELVGKEARVRQLEDELSRVQSTARDSVERLEELSATEARTTAKLHAAHAEVAETRERIRQLEHAIETARAAVPVEPFVPAMRNDSAQADMERLRRECEAMGILTNDPVVLKVFRDLKKAAHSQAPVLLLGETGTGKEMFAHAVHRLSPRAPGPFVPVNMAAIRGELFEGEFFGHAKGAFTGAVGRHGLLDAASGGTVFLDEIGELELDLQAKLLRVLDTGAFYRVGESTLTRVDVRIVAATNRDLYAEVQAGRFREDLYYRLRSLVFRLPPLRERVADDVILLAQHFLHDLCRGREPLQLSQGAVTALTGYHWPGNVRELRHVLAQAVTMCEGPVITERDVCLDENVRAGSPSFGLGPSDEHLETEAIRLRREDEAVLTCLRRHRFDMQRTARTLGWDRSTVTQRLKGIGFQALITHDGNVHAAASGLAGDPALTAIVESRLRAYYANLVQALQQYDSVESAIAACRKRFRNLPERHFPAVEALIRRHFAEHHHV